MEQPPTARWKIRLGALAIGTVAIVFVFAFDQIVTTDLRLIYVVGGILLFGCAIWLGGKEWDAVAGILLVLPSVAVFSYYSMRVPALWLNDVLWIAVVVLGMVIVDLVRRRRGFATTLMIALLVSSGWYCFSYAPKQLASTYSRTKNISAPAFNLQAVSSGFDSANSGKIVVLDFFSTTCVPCIAELPQLMAVSSDLKHRRDVQFVLVASDKGDDTPEKFRAFAERHHVTLPLAFDPEGKAHDSFGLTGVPALVIVDRAGRVRFTHEGYNPAEAGFRRDLVEFINSLD